MRYGLLPSCFTDAVEHLKNTQDIIWEKTPGVKEGDIVSLYIGVPIKAVKYRCKVVNDNIKCEVLEQNKYAMIGDFEHNSRYMHLKVFNEYSDEITLTTIQELGMYMVRKQAKLSGKLEKFLSDVNMRYSQL